MKKSINVTEEAISKGTIVDQYNLIVAFIIHKGFLEPNELGFLCKRFKNCVPNDFLFSAKFSQVGRGIKTLTWENHRCTPRLAVELALPSNTRGSLPSFRL
jgi:hypothetical protein